MIREVVKIDEKLCDGCGNCVPGCHEGALQIIDGKARLISDLMCDGLGACLGECPVGALSIEKREAEPYNETKVMEGMVEKGKNTVIAHLIHLKEHGESTYLREGVEYLVKNQDKLPFKPQEVTSVVHNHGKKQHGQNGGGCPGSKSISFDISPAGAVEKTETNSAASQLRQWPVQMHLINPSASHFQGADVVIAADCVAFAMGNFHEKFLKGKALAIACPKLDMNQEIYVEKIKAMIEDAKINSLNVIIMEVPCCGGLLRMASQATSSASRKVPVKMTVVSVRGEVLQEEWV